MTTEEMVAVDVEYGLGAKATAVLPRRKLTGLPARRVIEEVTHRTQPDDSSRRAAMILSEVLSSNRVVDVEIARGSDGETGEGQPISLEDPVFPAEATQTLVTETPPVTEKRTIRLSESYVGGWLPRRVPTCDRL